MKARQHLVDIMKKVELILALPSRTEGSRLAGFTTSPPARRVRLGALPAAVIPAVLFTAGPAKAVTKTWTAAVSTDWATLALPVSAFAIRARSFRSRERVRYFTFQRFVNSDALRYFSTHLGRPPSVARPPASYQVKTGINTSRPSNSRVMKTPFLPCFQVGHEGSLW